MTKVSSAYQSHSGAVGKAVSSRYSMYRSILVYLGEAVHLGRGGITGH